MEEIRAQEGKDMLENKSLAGTAAGSRELLEDAIKITGKKQDDPEKTPIRI